MSFTKVLLVGVAVLSLALFFANDSFHLLPKGDIPGALELMQSSVERDKVQGEFDGYDAAFKGDAERDQTMVNAYYNMATDFYEYGWGTSFHFAHTLADESHEDSIARHEHRLADVLGLGPGKRAIDAGCGVGGPAREIASYSKANVVGVTLNKYQVERGRLHMERAGLSSLVELTQGDFTKLDFEDESFDGAYAIEATCHAPQLIDVYSEIFRVLKSGARFATYEWIVTDDFDVSNPDHVAISREIEYGNGLPPLRSAADVREAAAKAGFTMVSEVDLAQDREGTRVWYHKLDIGWFAHKLTHFTCAVSEFFGFAPKGTVDIHGILLRAADGLVRGGKSNSFTPMHLFVMQKP
jgi:24-methylenesterol C-methyltransferase